MTLLKITLITGIFLASSLSAQTDSQVLSESDLKQIESEISQVMDTVLVAAGRADAESMFRVIAEEGTLIRSGELMLSKDEAFRFYQQAYQRVKKVEYRFDHRKIQVLSKQAVLMIIDGESIVTTLDNRIFRTPFAQTMIFERDGKDWKVLHTHVSVQSG